MRGQRAAHTPEHTKSSFERLFFGKDPFTHLLFSPLFCFFPAFHPLYFSSSLSICFLTLFFSSKRHKRSHAVLLVWVEKGGLTPRKEEGWGDFWRQESRPQLMENRCGRERERRGRWREERRGERERGKERWREEGKEEGKSWGWQHKEGCFKVRSEVVYRPVSGVQTNHVCVSSCRGFDSGECCWSLSSPVVLSVLGSDSGHPLF